MAKRCLIQACKREAEIYCYHCSQDVCSKHFFEHKKWIQEQLPLLTDEVNLIYERFRHNDNAQTSVPSYFINIYNELDKWRESCRQQIDIVYQRVRSQVVDVAEKHEHDENQQVVRKLKSLESLRQQLNELLKEGDVTYRQLETMKQELEKIKTKELEQIKYPDIRIITQKFDASKYINITINTIHRTYEKQQPKYTKPSTQIE